MGNEYKIPRVVCAGGNGGVKKIFLGGENPVLLQTMWKESIVDLLTDKNAFEEILKKINTMQDLGCDIIRFAVPDKKSAEVLCEIAKNTSMPLVADIHFDYNLALACLKGNVAAIRINPGNIGKREYVEKVVNACKEKNVGIRIGVNSGSLSKDLQNDVLQGNISRAQALCKSAFREIEVFEELDFKNVVVSMKASSVQETIEANECFARQNDTPLHIGVTEAGPLIGGVVKSTLAFSHLLKEGIGSTIRVSLSSTPENEIIAGREILRECSKRSGGVSIVSCPRCGRVGFDVHAFVNRWEKRLLSLDKNVTIAIMGCIVNGPGEGKHADLGIAGATDKVIIFKKGKIIRTIDAKDADKVFEEELNLL